MVGTIHQIIDDIHSKIDDAQMFGDLDPREEADTKKVEASSDLVPIVLDDAKPEHIVMIGAHLSAILKCQLGSTLREHKDVFAWMNVDMPGIDPEVIAHRLNVLIGEKGKIQKRRSFNPERYLVINEEVEKLITAKFVCEAKFPNWVSNVVMVKKSNGK